MDYTLFEAINDPAGGHGILDSVMRHAATWAVPIFIAIVAAWFLIGRAKGRPTEREGAFLALFGAGGALLVNQIVSHLWQRPRPFAAHADVVHLLVARSTDPSFPSDHAAAAMAIAVAVAIFHRRVGMAVIALAVLVAYSRVFVGVHYPGDVLAGMAIGAGVTLLLWRPLSFLPGGVSRLATRTMRALRLPLHDTSVRSGA